MSNECFIELAPGIFTPNPRYRPTAPPTGFDKQGKALPAGYRKKVKDKRGQ